MMEFKHVIYRKERFKEGAVAKITLNRPETLNAMDVELTEDILRRLPKQRKTTTSRR